MTTGFVDTSTNMVSVVRSVIESYGMGSIRALAQEPVQNSKDAKKGSQVSIEFRLLRRRSADGKEHHILTVSDSGTTGLQGPILSQAEREARGLELSAGENWAAFEGQGFTRKETQDAIGSRGQGKSAFLYHSRPTNSNGVEVEKHLMLYDTLLDSGEYRLGIRYAMPADRVMEPPCIGDDARQLLARGYETSDGVAVSLGLEPLAQIGTRIIVPFLSEEAVEAFRAQEIHRWLQRCWWRAIQIGVLRISVVDDQGQRASVQVPSWWQDEPWRVNDERVSLTEDISIDGELKIKRIVLLYDETLQVDEIDGYSAQYSGVQLLRGHQWIETQDIRELIPPERRNGFRGFVEFDRLLERRLKDTEKPQHESFDGRNPVVRKVRETVSNAVRQFAEDRGWIRPTDMGDVSERERDLATEFFHVFASGVGSSNRRRQDPPLGPDDKQVPTWSCTLSYELPQAGSSRVDWGESIRNVQVLAECEPRQSTDLTEVILKLSNRSRQSSTVVAGIRDLEVVQGSAVAIFGDFQFVRDRGGEGKIRVPESGEWKLEAEVKYRGEPVVSTIRRLYVQVEPPPGPRSNPHTLSLSVKNLTREGDRRITDGDEIGIDVTATNRTSSEVELFVDASLEGVLFADRRPLTLAGVPSGDVPNRGTAVYQRLTVYTSPRAFTFGPHIVLEPGRYYARADLWGHDLDAPIAHASQPVYVEVNPRGITNQIPFELEAVEGSEPHAMWQLLERSADDWVLRYASQYPLYLSLPQARNGHSKLAGKSAFIAEVCANGLLEWALAPLDRSDASRIEFLRQSRPDGIQPGRWVAYCERIDRLEENFTTNRVSDFGAYQHLWRECVADMLDIFEELS